MNIEKLKTYLQDFNLSALFIEELGWDNPENYKKMPLQTKTGGEYNRQAIAQLSGVVVYVITSQNGEIPDAKERGLISAEIKKVSGENITIFIDKHQSQMVWRWLKTQDKKTLSREHFYFKEQTGDLFIAKLQGLFVDINEIEQGVMLYDVIQKLQKALDIEKVTKKFFAQYQNLFVEFYKLITGIDTEADQKWYASVLLHRLMFIYFLQKKGFVDNANFNYLNDKLTACELKFGENKFYAIFLEKLFFEGFAKPENQRDTATNLLIGKIKYLNGGLFLKHSIELKYPNIAVADIAFKNIFALFDSYSWSLNDTPNGKDNEINPDVLGYIFEKYINQKAFGAYYTRTEITEYLCEQTVSKLILEQMNLNDSPPSVSPLPPEGGTDVITSKTPPSGGGGLSIGAMLLNLDAKGCKKLLVGKNAILPNLSLLDPACGSGAFLVAAMKVLINVYAGVFGRIEVLADKDLLKWKKEITAKHPSLLYYIKKQIITNNLYGVDIMQEATEIAKLRLFLALVASATELEDLEPLPNIDFNIMAGNSLMGLVRVDDKKFGQLNIFQDKPYRQIVDEKERLIDQYKNPNNDVPVALQELKQRIDEQRAKDIKTLNTMLLGDFMQLKINYEQQTWDTEKNKEGKPTKRGLTLADIEALQPFHWEYEFSEIFKVKNGFDAIITNPPWEIFEPNGKEFLMEFSDLITKKKMNIKDFEKEQATILKEDTLRQKWETYLSRFPHQIEYYRRANIFANQVSEIDGKKEGSNINLYKLFTEQCYNLLKHSGYCGIVIPSGIYTDLGTKQLRKLLFEKTQISGLFCFENKKAIFEGVDSRFKFVVLSFEKGGETQSFPAAFMRHEVKELLDFPKYGAFTIKKELILKTSPTSFSIPEFKNDTEIVIADKLGIFPLLSDINGWNLELLGEEFNMSRGAIFFHKEVTEYPLYEGKMIWHFNANYALPQHYIKEEDVKKDFLSKKLKRIGIQIAPKDLSQDYETYRLAIRKIARNTDMRTLIATIIPKKSFVGNSLSVHFPFLHDKEEYNTLRYSYQDLLLLTALLSSFVVDYILRSRVTANVNPFYIYQLPVPRLQSGDLYYWDLVSRAARLVCCPPTPEGGVYAEYADLWAEVITADSPLEGGTDVITSKTPPSGAGGLSAGGLFLRAEIDAIVAKIYGLTEAELAYILSTFPIVAAEQKALVLEEFRKL